MTLWTGKETASALKIDSTPEFSADGVSIDSRTLKKGDLFVALKGEKQDGHGYAGDAFRAGAAAAVVEKSFQAANNDWPLIRVENTTRALEDLGRAARARGKAKIVGVAGSAGKTGTKELLAALFGALGKTHASKKSFNNHWGVPLSLANLPRDAAYGVFEIGMNHPGEIIPLTAQVRPDIALITTIDREHIEFFPNGLDGVADANAEIFTGMTKGGVAFLNRDNAYFTRLKAAAEKQGIEKIYGFGEDEEAGARLIDCTLHSDGSKVTANILGETVKYRLLIPGKHIVLNSLGALAVVKAAGGDIQRAAEALKDALPVEGRGNRHTIMLEPGQPPLTVIDESYNANPASMQAAFRVLELTAPKEKGRRIAVLGDMLELGKDGPRLHAELANPLLKARTDLLFCCGPLMEALYSTVPENWQGGHASDSRSLIDKLMPALKPGDVLLVKGSLGSKMAYIIQALNGISSMKDTRHAL